MSGGGESRRKSRFFSVVEGAHDLLGNGGGERASEGWDKTKDFVEGAGAPVGGSSSSPCSSSSKKSEAGSPSNPPHVLFVYIYPVKTLLN